MGVLSTESGLFMFFVFVFPGFFSVVVFRWTAGYYGKMNSLGWLCCSVLFGMIDLAAWQSTQQNNTSEIIKVLGDPLRAAIALSTTGVIVALILGLIIGWLRRKFR